MPLFLVFQPCNFFVFRLWIVFLTNATCVICIQEFMVVGGGGSYVGHLALWDFFLLWFGIIFLVAKLLFSALMLRCLPALDTDSLAMITM